MVVQVLPTPLSLKPTPPLNLEDDILVDVENLDWGGTHVEESGRFGVGIIALRDREEEDESSGSPEMFNRETFMFQDGITLKYVNTVSTSDKYDYNTF